MEQQTFPVSRKDELVIQQLKDEVLIYDLKINKAYCLNETSALIWQMCDGNNSITDISKQLSKKLNSKVDDDFVWLAIDGLKKDNLLADSAEVVPEFNGLSRREVIRKVGLASMIALPVISSLVAPTAAQAQSPVACRTVGQTCSPSNSVGNCCQGVAFCNNAGACTQCFSSGTTALFCGDGTQASCQSLCQSFGYLCCSGRATPQPTTFFPFVICRCT